MCSYSLDLPSSPALLNSLGSLDYYVSKLFRYLSSPSYPLYISVQRVLSEKTFYFSYSPLYSIFKHRFQPMMVEK